jgi:hypothetical protein
MSTITSSSLVILEKEENYLPWIELIKIAAAKDDLWLYINPSLPPKKLKILEALVELTLALIRTISNTSTPNIKGVSQASTSTATITFADLKGLK